MTPLEPEKYYHLYNRANGEENIFVAIENYYFFLKKYKQYINPIVDTYSYCLMPNHFHFLISIKSKNEIENLISFSDNGKQQSIENFISKRFSNFFSAYTQSFNRQQCRRGSLFMKNFKRKPVEDEKYLYKLIHYIHNNPVEANLCAHPSEWIFSSYQTITSNKRTDLKRKEALRFFDNLENFIFVHSQLPKISGLEKWLE